MGQPWCPTTGTDSPEFHKSVAGRRTRRSGRAGEDAGGAGPERWQRRRRRRTGALAKTAASPDRSAGKDGGGAGRDVRVPHRPADGRRVAQERAAHSAPSSLINSRSLKTALRCARKHRLQGFRVDQGPDGRWSGPEGPGRRLVWVRRARTGVDPVRRSRTGVDLGQKDPDGVWSGSEGAGRALVWVRKRRSTARPAPYAPSRARHTRCIVRRRRNCSGAGRI